MKTRIISAAVAILIAVPIIYLGGNIFTLFAGLLGIIGYYEFLKARKVKRDIPFIMKLVGVFILTIIMMNINNKYFFLDDFAAIAIIVFLTPIVIYNKSKKYSIEDAIVLLGITLFLGLAFNKFISTRLDNLFYFIYLLLITIMTDTFAYFTGYFFGKHKMSPTVSPNKTWEGFLGGLILGTVSSSAFYYILINNQVNVFLLIVVSACLSIIGQIGDLLFSTIKRYYNIKDYGNLMPGHGGVLDRLDSILFVMLAYIYLSRFL